jgi:hypothetical protein
MSWLYQPLLPGGGQQQAGGATTEDAAGSVSVTTAVTGVGTFEQAAVQSRGGFGLSEEEYQAQLKRNKRQLKRLEERRRETEALLRRLLREAMYGPDPVAAPVVAAIEEAIEAIPAPPMAAVSSAAQIQRLEIDLSAVIAQIDAIETAMARHQDDMDDEDDIETLLLMAA